MRTSTWVQAGAALLAFAACSATQASTTNLGTLSIGVPTPFSGSALPAGQFDDIFTFILPANGGSGYSVVNFPLSIPGVGTFNTVLSTMSLVSDPDGIPFSPDDNLVAHTLVPGGNSLTLTFGPTGGGAMYLDITGITNGTMGGLYSGAISVSPVPIPAAAGLLLAGLGLVGT